jgi:hypothetical protein
LKKEVGCDLLFCNFLDNHEDQFKEIKRAALKESASLHAVFEVDKITFNDTDWTVLAPGLNHVQFEIKERCAAYADTTNHDANVNGSATFFLDEKNAMRSIVLVERDSRNVIHTRDLTYLFKTVALLQEAAPGSDLGFGIQFELLFDSCKVTHGFARLFQAFGSSLNQIGGTVRVAQAKSFG